MRFSYVQQIFLFGLLIGVTGVFLFMLSEYMSSLLWALICAIIFFPLYIWLETFFKGRSNVAALATLLTVVLLVVLPLVFIGSIVVSESVSLYQSLSADEKSSFEGSSLLGRVNQVTVYLEPYGISQAAAEERIREWIASLSLVVASSLVAFSQLTISFLIKTVVMLYLLFFFLRDGIKLKAIIMHYLPLGAGHEALLMNRFGATVQAVVKGTLAISVIQGIIGGILFFAVGIANPVLWGVTMAVLSLIPLLGTAVIWVPAALLLIATGSVWSGIIILLVGGLVISLVDNFLRPILVGRGAKMPDALVLLATIGGLATFGVSGFIIGPIIAALFLSLWAIFEERYRVELLKN